MTTARGDPLVDQKLSFCQNLSFVNRFETIWRTLDQSGDRKTRKLTVKTEIFFVFLPANLLSYPTSRIDVSLVRMSLCSDKGGGFRGSRRRLMYFSFRSRRENCSGTTSPVAFVESFCSCAPQQVRALHFFPRRIHRVFNLILRHAMY